MRNAQVAVVVGSLRRESINRKLAVALSALAPDDVPCTLVSIAGLPMYNQDEENIPNTAVQAFRDAIAGADAVLFVTPEFNRSIPGALKNALDVGSRPYGKSVWAGRAAGVIGASPGGIGTAVAQQHLRNILAHLNMRIMGQPEGFIQVREGFFDEQGNIANPDSKAFLQRWMDSYTSFVKTSN